MKTYIYLVRHGQTAWNKEEIFRGRTDIPLDETGLKQAELTGEFFRDKKIHRIYSSPLSRAWETAQKIAQIQGLTVQALQGIIDMDFGRWEGKSHRDIQENDKEIYRKWREEPHRVRLPEGETLDEVRERSLAGMEEVIQENLGKTIVLVSHRVICKVLICAILGLDNSHFWQIAQDTTAINLIQYQEGKYILSLMNETCHLKPLREEKPKIDF